MDEERAYEVTIHLEEARTTVRASSPAAAGEEAAGRLGAMEWPDLYLYRTAEGPEVAEAEDEDEDEGEDSGEWGTV